MWLPHTRECELAYHAKAFKIFGIHLFYRFSRITSRENNYTEAEKIASLKPIQYVTEGKTQL